tara:strand:+ start:1795 stop:1980 length:186 start_codon:yes stop_codon:yes gene_type:complete
MLDIMPFFIQSFNNNNNNINDNKNNNNNNWYFLNDLFTINNKIILYENLIIIEDYIQPKKN